MPSPSPSKQEHREIGIDAMRLAMALSVVLLHSLPASSAPSFSMGDALVAIFCRGAVPFFFITGGYFLTPPPKARPFDAITKPLKRLTPIFIFWMAVYYVFCFFAAGHPWTWTLRDLISGGTAFHLWFLPALGFGLASVALGVRLLGTGITAAIVTALAILTLLYNAYYAVLSPIGPPTRGGFLIAPAYVFLGYLLQKQNLAWARVPTACAAVIASLACLVAEEFLISSLSGEKFRSHDFAISTFPLGVSVFLLAKQINSGKVAKSLSRLGPLSLGIYTSHLVFIWSLEQILPELHDHIILAWLTSSALALLTTHLLKRISLLNRVV